MMRSQTFYHIQNEGALLQHCFKSAIIALRGASSMERGGFYVAFFNYSIGFERLLKVLLQMEHRKRLGKFLGKKEFNNLHDLKSGHELDLLFSAAQKLYPLYNLQCANGCLLDQLDHKLITFLSGFATRTRYFNLDALAPSSREKNPLAEWQMIINEVFLTDVPELCRISAREQADARIDVSENFVTYVPSMSMEGKLQSYSEICHEEQKIELILPEVCWRLTKILVPLKDLLVSVREGSPEPFPVMEDFLDFVCADKEVMLKSSDWP